MNIKLPTYVPGHGLLKNKSVLITAAAGAGIGFSAATRSVEEGCRAIVISDVHEGRLNASVEKLKEETGFANVWGKVCNVADEEQVQALIAFAEEKLGGVDVLINNAGLGTTKALVDMEDPEWFKVIDVTLNGTMRMTRHMMKVMKARGQGGVIVNNASVLGWRAQKEQSHYAAAKAGVMALTRCAALEAADFGVRINAVAPGLTFAEVSSTTLLADPAQLSALEALTPLGRIGQPADIAKAILYLASDDAEWITGQILDSSGGWWIAGG